MTQISFDRHRFDGPKRNLDRPRGLSTSKVYKYCLLLGLFIFIYIILLYESHFSCRRVVTIPSHYSPLDDVSSSSSVLGVVYGIIDYGIQSGADWTIALNCGHEIFCLQSCQLPSSFQNCHCSFWHCDRRTQIHSAGGKEPHLDIKLS